MKDMWKHRNLPGEVIGITPSCYEIVHKGICEFYDDVDRGYEIQGWIDTHEIDNYVILDDDNNMLDTQRNNFVRTSENTHHDDCIGIGYGLTKICAGKAIEILNRK